MFNNGVINLILFSFLTGFGSLFVKLIQGLSSQQILFYRALMASLFLFVLAIISKKTNELVLKHPINTLVMGLTQGLSIFFYYLALERTTIANAVLLVYTAPLFSVMLSALFLHEKIEKKTYWAILSSFIGILIIIDPTKLQLNSTQLYGSVYALIGGFLYSAMAISSKSLTHKTTPLYCAFWQYCIIMILSFLFAFPIQISSVKLNILPILYLGWAAGGLAFLLYMKGINKVKGQIIQVITVLEIIIGSISGVIVLHESLSLFTIIGGFFILLGVYIVSLKNINKNDNKKQILS